MPREDQGRDTGSRDTGRRDTGSRVTSPWSYHLADPVRVGGLSDGLFAIVLTLLVLEFRVPEQVMTEPLAAAEALWTSLFGYILTFVIGGMYWMLHHRYLEAIRHVDRRLLWINLMFLMCVGFLPYPTGLLGRESGGAFAFGWFLYSLDMVLIGVTLTAFLGYAGAAKLLDPSVTASDVRRSLARSLVTPAAFLVAAVLAAFGSPLATYAPFLIVPGQLALRERHQDRPRARGTIWMFVGFTPVVLYVLFSIWLAIRSP